MPTYRVLERFFDGEQMHEIHDFWNTEEKRAAWNLSKKRIELVVLPYAHLGQRIIEEVLDVPKRTTRYLQGHV